MGPDRSDLRPGRPDFRPGRPDFRLKSRFQASVGWTGASGLGRGEMDGRTDRCMEIHPCVLQDIGPLGPLPKKANQVFLAGAVMQKMPLKAKKAKRYRPTDWPTN